MGKITISSNGQFYPQYPWPILPLVPMVKITFTSHGQDYSQCSQSILWPEHTYLKWFSSTNDQNWCQLCKTVLKSTWPNQEAFPLQKCDVWSDLENVSQNVRLWTRINYWRLKIKTYLILGIRVSMSIFQSNSNVVHIIPCLQQTISL